MSNTPHYNAFISYRHHPQDIAVAEAIHKGLERFKVPRSLKKQGKKIERIFRDKEELPITSSLTDTITTALRNSDFQIVICSTHLKDSYWVQREIETFLQTHTKDQILTVIVDGEPNEVIPEILTYREVTDPRTGEIVREPLEPLSCDWRIGKRKAMKVELPRLAAVLLGCTYNDLIQRQKQYQMQRMAAGFSVALALSLGFGAYFLYSSIQIQENLNQSLRNQSQYLASASEDLYENGDRLTAIALALEALPTEEGERPYVIEAEQALANALNLYNPNTSFIATTAFTADQPIELFTLSPEGDLLYIQDNHRTVTTWNTDTGARLGTIQLGSINYTLATDGAGNLLTMGRENLHTLSCYAPDGTLLWEQENVNSFACTRDYSLIVAAYSSITTGKAELKLLDPADGNVLAGPVQLSVPGTFTSSGAVTGLSYEADLPFPAILEEYEDRTYTYVGMAYDAASGTTREYLRTPNKLVVQTVTPDGQLLFGENISVYAEDDLSDLRECTIRLHSFRPDGSPLWTAELVGYRTGRVQLLEPIPDGTHLLVQLDNALYVLDSATGAITARHIASANPAAVEPGTDGATVIYDDGSVVWLDYTTGGIHYTDFQVDSGLAAVEVNRGIYVSKDLSPTLLQYISSCDDSYTIVEDLGDVYLNLYTDDLLTCDTHMAMIAKDSLRCYDLTTGTLLWTADWPRSTGSLLGFAPDSGMLYAQDEEKVRCYNIADGSMTTLDFPTKFWIYGSFATADDHLYYLDTSRYQDDTLWLVDWDLATDTYTEYEFSSYIERQSADLCYADRHQAIVRSDSGTLCRLSLDDGSTVILQRDTREYPALYIDPETGSITLAHQQSIVVLDESFHAALTIDLPEVAAMSLFRHNGLLLAVCDDEALYCFDEEGTLVQRYALTVYENFFNSTNLMQSLAVPISWTVTDTGELVLNIFGAGNIIDLDQSLPRYQLQNLLHCHPGTGKLYCYANNGHSILSYDLLSTRDIIARAHETLGTFTLTPDQRSTYGLN